MRTYISIFVICLLPFLTLAQLKVDCDSLIKMGIVQLGKKEHNASLENLNKAYVLAKENR